MGLLTRSRIVVASKYSRLLHKAENPAEMLDYSYEQMLGRLNDVKRGIIDLATSRKRLELQQAVLEENIVKLDGQAREALAADREDLTVMALERKTMMQAQLRGMDGQVATLQEQQDKLQGAERHLVNQIETFRFEKEVLKAQYTSAATLTQIGETAAGLSSGMRNTGVMIQRSRDKIQELQARSQAIDELIAAGDLTDYTSGTDALEKDLAAIAQTSSVQAELRRLRAELGTGQGEQKALA